MGNTSETILHFKVRPPACGNVFDGWVRRDRTFPQVTEAEVTADRVIEAPVVRKDITTESVFVAPIVRVDITAPFASTHGASGPAYHPVAPVGTSPGGTYPYHLGSRVGPGGRSGSPTRRSHFGSSDNPVALTFSANEGSKANQVGLDMPSYHAVAKSPQQMPHVDPNVVRLLLRLAR